MSNGFSDVITDGVKSETELSSLRQLTLVIYVLYALSWLAGITSLIAIIVNHVKRDDVRGTLYESHFSWQIRTFWWGLLWCVLGALTFWIVIGMVIWFVAGIWFIYRLVKGWLYWNDRKSLPM